MGRSYCPHCKKGISWYDNVPLLSFIILGAKCRRCRKKISWQYPLVEFFTGLIFALVGAKFFSALDSATWAVTFYYLVTLSFLVVILVYDFLYMEIPGLALWPAIGFVVALNLFLDWSREGKLGGPLDVLTYSGVLAGFCAFIFFFLLVAISRERWMGIGDAYLAILLGLILGWPQIVFGLFLAFLLGSIYGIILIAMKKKTAKSQIPFAPFLVLGTVLAVFFYAPVVTWYFGLLSF